MATVPGARRIAAGTLQVTQLLLAHGTDVLAGLQLSDPYAVRSPARCRITWNSAWNAGCTAAVSCASPAQSACHQARHNVNEPEQGTIIPCPSYGSFIMSKQRPQRPAQAGRLRTLTILVGVLAVIVLALVIGSATLLPRNDRILQGVTMNGTPLGGKTRAEARTTVDGILARSTGQEITLQAASGQRSLTLHALGIRTDAGDVVQRAYGVGRQGNLICRLTQALRARQTSLPVAPTFTLDNNTAKDVLADFGHAIDQPPVNASARWNDAAGKVVIEPGRTGRPVERKLPMSTTVSVWP
jgi:hypothetical protein